MPFASWLRGELWPVVEDALSPEAVRRRSLLRHGAVRRLLQQFAAGHGAWDQVWTLTMLELWHRQVLDAPTARSEAPSRGLVAHAGTA